MILLERATYLGELFKTGLVSSKFTHYINQLNMGSEQDELLFHILMISGKQILLICKNINNKIKI